MYNLRANIVHIIANTIGQTELQAEIRTQVFLGYIIVLLVLIPLHRKLLQSHKKIHENLILLYDTLRYKVAQAQYSNSTIQDRKGINVIIEKHQKNYENNNEAIYEEVVELEKKAGQEIITVKERETIHKQLRKKKTYLKGTQVLGRPLTALTAGIYKLFW